MIEYGLFVEQYAQEKGLSRQDAAQTLMQVLALKHVSYPGARLIGGGALVFGHGNPRFSEDIDLAGVPDTSVLEPGLRKTLLEIQGWFQKPAKLIAPKGTGRTWRILCQWNRAESLQLHVDSQKYRAWSVHPVVISFPGIPSFIVESLSLEELMAEKLLAVFGRRTLGGRDLFDLWFHWLRLDNSRETGIGVQKYLPQKLKERGISRDDFFATLKERLSLHAQGETQDQFKRAQEEWKRYLPLTFQKKTVYEEILRKCGELGTFL